MRHCKLLGLAALAMALLPGLAPAQTTLHYKFKQGDKLPYSTVSDAVGSMTFGGADVEFKFKMSADAALSVVKVESDGSARVRVKVGRVKISLESPTANGEFDSASKEDAEGEGVNALLAKIGKQLASLDVAFTVAPDGRASDIELPKAKKMKGGGGGLDKMFGDLFTPEQLLEAFNLPSLPKDAVSKGDTWEEKKTVGTPVGKISAGVKYKYEGQVDKGGKKLEKLGFIPSLKGKVGAADAKMPFKVNIKSSKGKGVAYFDNQAGRLVESTNEVTMDMEASFGELMIPMRVTQNATLRLKRAKSQQ